MNSENRKETWRERFGRWIPARQVHIRTDGRVRYLTISTGFQIFALAVFAGAAGWTGYASHSYVRHNDIVADKDADIANARLAYHSLLGEVADYQRKFTSITEDLETNHGLMLALVEKNASLQQSLKSVSKQLATTENEREQIEGARENLKGKLGEIENELHDMASRNYLLTDNLSTVEHDLQTALSERNQALFDGTKMRRKISRLESRLVDLERNQEFSVQRLTGRALASIEKLERVIEIAGLDAEDLYSSRKTSGTGQGGPFIPADETEDLPGGGLKSNLEKLDNHLGQWESLQSIMRRLPLAAPMDAYYVTSSFGKRRDPINKRWSAHYGLDLGGTKKSKVYATAPGTVTFAGWKGKYGRLIEIDHGSGLKTRYGHLHKIYVKRGQKVKFREKIGLLGNSGRSTSAHLHYETVFKGRAKNPMKFIKASRYVFQEK